MLPEREEGLVLWDMAARVLKGGADAPIKLFRGIGLQELVQDARGRFAKVRLVEPAVWRSRSPEMYLLAKDFRLV
ncbi:MAG TPA: SAM-dependent methyltransferase [Candidatus Methylacidiphilales bacterium]|nr:SAM-dependent methyltransferase [Candidatus Methylacidiphilales bacterium]